MHEINKFYCSIVQPLAIQIVCINDHENFSLDHEGILTIEEECYIKGNNFILKSHSIKSKEVPYINPKFKMANITRVTKNLNLQPNKNKTIFIKDYKEEYNILAKELQELEKEEKYTRTISNLSNSNYTNKVVNLIGVFLLILIISIIFYAKLRKLYKCKKLDIVEDHEVNSVHIPRPSLCTCEPRR